MKPPEHVKVLTKDNGRVGHLGAQILALVRYVTAVPPALPKDPDGRREIYGLTWWRATAEEITDALGGGISPRSVSRTVLQLTASGDLRAISTHDFHGDRAKAYRVSDLTSDNMSEAKTASDLTSDNMSDPLGHIGRAPRTICPTPSDNMADVPIPEELEEEKQEPPYPPSGEASPEHSGDSANGAGEQSNLPEVIDAEIVPEERGQERGRSNPVDVSASRLVSTLVPASFPAAFKTALRLKASQLIRGDGIASEVVAESIRRLLARPDAGVGLLPHIAAQVLREGTAPAPKSKARTVAEWAREARAAEQANHQPDRKALEQ